MNEDAFFVIGIFAFVFILWMGHGGPNRPLSLSSPILRGTVVTLPKMSGISSNNYTSSRNSINTNTSGKVEYPMKTFNTDSPYRGLVTVGHYVSGAGSADPSHEYLTLRVSTNSRPVNITGWTLESGASGSAEKIKKGTEVPHSGIINASQSIILNPGDTATISSGRSPIGASFRENICIGYFAQYQSFYPSLPLTCPTPFNELKTYYPNNNYIRDVPCIEYTKSLNRCSLVASPPINLSGACSTFIVNHLNYNGCVSAHENEPHFEGTNWRIYLGRNKSMWRPQYETVKLLDANGKLVDTFSY